MADTITMPQRKVHHTIEGDYIVLEKRAGKWHSISRRYPYVTSAQAALGRMVSQEVEKLNSGAVVA